MPDEISRVGFPGGALVENLPASSGDARDAGRSPRAGNSNPLQYSSWKIPQTEKSGQLLSLGYKGLDMLE